MIKDDAETLAMWRQAVTAPHGTNQHTKKEENDNIIIQPEQGTSRAYTLDRLSREAPALYEKVVAGTMSANAAAIEAGFRRKPSPLDQIIRLLPKLTDDERRAVHEATRR